MRIHLKPWLALFLFVFGVQAFAETRRAVVIGIDHYDSAQPSAEIAAGRSQWSNLDGAVNDATSMAELLRKKFGFAEVTLITNDQATRQGIVDTVRAKLIAAPVKKGDVSVLYYAGHGSWMKDSSDPRGRVETIVPYDAPQGALDIRDKEIRQLLNQMLDKGAIVTAIFDSCHSGSISRGRPTRKSRAVQPDNRDAAKVAKAIDPGPVPRDRGALILSAALDTQPAEEGIGDDALPHGIFTAALLRTLQNVSGSESASEILRRVRSTMATAMAPQTAELEATPARQNTALFGVGIPDAGRLRLVAKPGKTTGEYLVDGGIIFGLAPNTVLREVTDRPNPVRLQIKETAGAAQSVAIIAEGDAARIPGALFEVETAVLQANPLRVWWPGQGAEAETIAAAVNDLSAMTSAGLKIVEDSNGEPPQFLASWNEKGWRVAPVQGASAATEGASLAQAVRKLGRAAEGPQSVYVDLPPSTTLAAAIQLGAGTKNDAVVRAERIEDADYVLQGRVRDGKPEYAWVAAHVGDEQAEAVAMPLRTDWVPVDGGKIDRAGAQLEDLALALGRVRLWRNLVPPADTRFPYKLALRNVKTSALVREGEVRGGETYRIVLVADGKPKIGDVQRRYVYVFTIDQHGTGTLLHPGENSVSTMLPPDDAEALPSEIELGEFDVAEPYGSDTFLMVSSAQRIDSPQSVFNFAGVRREGIRGDPLTVALFSFSGARAGRAAVPTNWSLERLSIRSVDPKAGK
jgi:hypothetical protein